MLMSFTHPSSFITSPTNNMVQFCSGKYGLSCGYFALFFQEVCSHDDERRLCIWRLLSNHQFVCPSIFETHSWINSEWHRSRGFRGLFLAWMCWGGRMSPVRIQWYPHEVLSSHHHHTLTTQKARHEEAIMFQRNQLSPNNEAHFSHYQVTDSPTAIVKQVEPFVSFS